MTEARRRQGDTPTAGYLHGLTSNPDGDYTTAAVAHAAAMAAARRVSAPPTAARDGLPVATAVAGVTRNGGSPRAVADALVRGWMGHPPSRAVVLRPGTDRGGCGVATGGGRLYAACPLLGWH